MLSVNMRVAARRAEGFEVSGFDHALDCGDRNAQVAGGFPYRVRITSGIDLCGFFHGLLY